VRRINISIEDLNLFENKNIEIERLPMSIGVEAMERTSNRR